MEGLSNNGFDNKMAPREQNSFLFPSPWVPFRLFPPFTRLILSPESMLHSLAQGKTLLPTFHSLPMGNPILRGGEVKHSLIVKPFRRPPDKWCPCQERGLSLLHFLLTHCYFGPLSRLAIYMGEANVPETEIGPREATPSLNKMLRHAHFKIPDR